MRGIGAIRGVLQLRSIANPQPPCSYLVSLVGRQLHSGDEDGEGRSEEGVGGKFTGKFGGGSDGMSLKSKTEVPYKGIQGLNVPYPKIPNDMGSYVFRDMAT